MASIVSAGTTSATALNMSADTSGVLQLASNNGTVGLTMDTSQNVGIGATNPSQKLDVNGSIIVRDNFFRVSNAGTVTSFFGLGTAVSGGTANDTAIRNDTGALLFSTNGSTERMRISSAGNLLLGVTSDTGLSAGGDFALKNGAAIRFRNTANSAYLNILNLDASENLLIGGGGTPANITFAISGIGEVGRFSSGGNLLIGTTSTVANAKLTVNGQIATSGFIAINASTATTVATGVSFLAVVRCRGSGGSAVVLYENAQTPVIIAQTGTVGFTTGAPGANQIQLANAAGNQAMTALSGSSVGNNNLNITVIANQ